MKEVYREIWNNDLMHSDLAAIPSSYGIRYKNGFLADFPRLIHNQLTGEQQP